MTRNNFAKVFLILVLTLGLAAGVSATSIQREFLVKQAGQELGTTTITLAVADNETHLNTVVVYPTMGLEIHSDYIFSGTDFPKQPLKYDFSIVSGGVLDLEMNWDDVAEYQIAQLGQTITLPNANVLALDNNVISDYMVATWLFDQESMDILTSNLVVPVMLPQGSSLVPMSVTYVGEEQIGSFTTDHYQVNIGVIVDIWVDPIDRSLVKLQIPMQAFELDAIGLETEPEMKRSFKDFGGHDFVETELMLGVNRAVISGTLSVPNLVGKFPGVVLVAGSGPTDRDGNSYLMPGPADYLKEIAHYLASRGIAVLRFDKRGIGASPGQVDSFSDYVDDIVSLTANFKEIEFIDADKVFIFGHSEGAWLASEAALKDSDLAGIGLLSGAGFSFYDTIKRQLLAQTDAAIAAGLFEETLSDRVVLALDSMYDSIVNSGVYNVSDYNLPDEIEQLILSFVLQGDLLKDWLVADPAAVLAEVKVPVLIIQGTADVQIGVEDAQALAAALPDEQRQIHIFEGLDHILKMTEGEPLSYTDPERRVDLKLLETLSDWILDQ